MTGERLLAFEAMQLLIRLDGLLRDARADWNQDRFRRLMRLRARVMARMHRRWSKLEHRTGLRLGALRRRYHAKLSCYLYGRSQ
jgi:hypothetical protein